MEALADKAAIIKMQADLLQCTVRIFSFNLYRLLY